MNRDGSGQGCGPNQLTERQKQYIIATYTETENLAETARLTGHPRSTCYGVLKRAGWWPEPEPNSPPESPAHTPSAADDLPYPNGPAHFPAGKYDRPSLPDPVPAHYRPFPVDTPGTWLVLNDVHLPYHDRETIELAVREARRRQVAGVLLNGDILDSHEISFHERDRGAPSYVEEIHAGRQFFAWLRYQLPRARVVFKEGNHDVRVQRYVDRNAPALSGLEELGLQNLLQLKDHGVEWVADKRVVRLGKLNVIHGHEYPGASSAVNPARGVYLKARSVVMVGHYHRTSEHHSRNILGTYEGAWSVGCACYLHPKWLPLNEWSHGFAFVTLSGDGWFQVENHRVIDGKMV